MNITVQEKRMGTVKTKKKFSFSNEKEKQRVRGGEDNEEHNGINIPTGALIVSVSTLSPASAADGTHGHLDNMGCKVTSTCGRTE